MTGPGRTIIAGSDLPRSFAVIESASYLEAVQDMRDAFANPETHLVVWNRAADLVSERMKREIRILCDTRIETQRFDELNKANLLANGGCLNPNDTPVARLHHHFNDVACDAGLPGPSFMSWEEDSRAFVSALQTGLNADSINKMLRVLTIPQEPFLHYDFMKETGDFIALRNLSGDPTEYFDPADYRGRGKIYNETQETTGLRVKDGAMRWMAGPLAMTFHSGKILHSAPSVRNNAVAAGQIRVNEFFFVSSKKDLLACHRSP